MDSVPDSLPALRRAFHLSEQAASVGFDWPDVTGILDKIREEIDELAEAHGADELEHEYGDLLFALANLGRFIDVEPERALQAANRRFVRRFAFVEQGLRRQGIDDATLEQMESLWQRAKLEE